MVYDITNVATFKNMNAENVGNISQLIWDLKECKQHHNNNKMERMNGEVGDREKVMCGLKILNTAVIPGYQIYHNYFRPHEALDGKTPAEKCEIIIEGDDKCKTVIENAVKRVITIS